MNDSIFLIDCEELDARLGDADLCIVDCRFDLKDPSAGYAQYLEGHIPGAVFADLDKDLAATVVQGTGRHPLPDASAFMDTMGRLGISNDSKVVCYDQSSGALAARLWWLLRWVGHDHACLLNGGIERWQSSGKSIDVGAVNAPPRDFYGVAREDLVIETEEIVGTARGDLLLVDARDEDRFAGRIEPIDAVAGHIPGSINVPFSASLRDDGTWKNPDMLRDLWDEALGGDAGSAWSVMCGSGVTACHLVVSALLAGLPEPRVYVGSWSEWITEPERPVEVDP